MPDPKYVTEVVYKVYDNQEGVHIAVGPSPDFPGMVNVSTGNYKACEEWFGKIDINLEPDMAEELAGALIRAAGDARASLNQSKKG